MSGGAVITDEIIEELPPQRSRPRSRGKWPLVVAALLIAAGVAIALAWPVSVPYYTLSPGPVYDTSDFITVDDPAAVGDASGELFFLTVSLQEANVFQWIAAQFSPKVDLSPRENIRPAGTSREELRRENLARMEQSKKDATFVALTQLGYEPTYTGTGALVTSIVEGSAADGALEVDDVIIAIDSEEVAFMDDLISLVQGNEIGDSIVVTVVRTTETTDQTEVDPEGPPLGEGEEVIDVTLTLGPHSEDPTRPMIGITLVNNDPIDDFPVEVDIDSQNIGGPSAGMMFTLEIMNQLTEQDLTGGIRIAGTGTIRRDGSVGPIGGVKQKVFAAIDAGATVVFIPAANYEDALAAAGDDIIVVRVETIDDPLTYLAQEFSIDIAA